MGLAPRTRLGVYEVAVRIGAGGMGDVYRARDTKLDRDVAIKVVPPHLATDEAMRARFEREAKAIAALSHPNILAIHDFGLHDGVAYAVTELLQGETLRERLQSGALPLRKTLQFGAEIASGLAAAHDKGFVHRDLKPENVFVGTDGHVKILDFGLARQSDAAAAGEHNTIDSRTVLRQTDPGTVMGTVGYMAPEQVKGAAVDHRADIFSLGCVLYEMAAGRRAFARDTAAETMTAILREDPPELSADAGGARPAAFDNVVRHCLEKRPEERFQSARDLAFALQSLRGTSPSGAHTAGAAAPARPRQLTLAGALIASAVIVALFSFLAGRSTSRQSAVASAGPQVVSFTQVTDQPGVEATPSLSPDGKSVVYAKSTGADTALYLLRVGSRNAVRLSGDAIAHDMQPVFSPDGERIAFRSDREGGGVFLMTASGESVTRLTDFGFNPSWSPDGAEITVSPQAFLDPTGLYGDAPGLSIVNVKSRQARALPVTVRAIQPNWSPHGARIAFWGIRGQGGQRDIWTIAADGSDAAAGGVPITNDAALDWSPTWSPDGAYLYFSSTRGGTMNLWRVPIDERSGRVRGEAEAITAPSTWSGDLSFSRDGSRLAFASLDYRSTLLKAPFDISRGAIVGPPVPILKGTHPIRDHELSPDGNWVAFTEAGAQEDLFVARTDGSQYRRLTDDAFRDRGPAWSSDGTTIAFYTDRSGAYDVWTIRPDGSRLTPLTHNANIPGFPVWTPSGTRLAFGYSAWHVLDAQTPPSALPAAEPPFGRGEIFIPSSWSPQGDRIVGAASSGAVATVAVYTIASRTFTRVPGEAARGDFWVWPVWLADGRRLLVRRQDGVTIVDAASGASQLLIPVGGNIVGRSVGVSRDNRWITYTETATEGDIWLATLRNTASSNQR